MKKAYRATKNHDGTWNIYDVEIYAANVRSFGMVPVLAKDGDIKPEELVLKHDGDWLQQAIETAKVDFDERGYEAPLHVNHHGRDEQVVEAGTIMPRYVRKTLYEGKLLDTLFADLRNVPDAIYQQIKAGRLRYRSAEVPPTMQAKPEIKGLALLPHQPPHFKLPPLRVENAEENLALAGMYSTGKTLHMLSCFEADTDEGREETSQANDKSTGDQSVKNEDPKSKGGLMEKLMLLLSAIAAKLGIGTDDTQSSMPKGPAEQPRGDEAKDPLKLDPAAAYRAKVQPVTPGLPVMSIDPAEWTALKAKLAVYDSRFANMDAETNAKTAVDKALDKLKGRNITDKMRADLFEAAKLGEKPLAMYVSVIEAAIPLDPPKDPLSISAAAGSREPYPAEVLSYQAQGEAVLAKAVESWQTYKVLGARVAHVKLADFLKANVSAELGQNFLSTN